MGFVHGHQPAWRAEGGFEPSSDQTALAIFETARVWFNHALRLGADEPRDSRALLSVALFRSFGLALDFAFVAEDGSSSRSVSAASSSGRGPRR